MEDSFYNQLSAYVMRQDRYPFHMPGHKRQSFEAAKKRLLSLGISKEIVDELDIPKWMDVLLAHDVTEVPELDDLNHPTGRLLTLQKELSGFYKSKESFLMVNGSTGGLIASIEAATKIGGEILIARNCHTSVYRQIIHRGLVPRYLFPQMDTKMCIATTISPKDVNEAMNKYDKAKVVVIVSPTYEGVILDVEGIAKVVHQNGGVLIVDEAHGAHFAFTDRYISAVNQSADLVVQSLHKTLPALTQTAVLHCMSDRMDLRLLRDSVSYIQTTSPSYLLVAQMDACMRFMMKAGTFLLDHLYQKLDKFYNGVNSCKNLVFFQMPDRDISKICFGTKYGQMDGLELAAWLREHAGIEIEMCTVSYVLLMATAFDEENAIERLLEAIYELDEFLQVLPKNENTALFPYVLSSDVIDLELTPYEASRMMKNRELVSLEDAQGYIAADTVYVYPPGIPILVMGEKIKKEQLLCIIENLRHGFTVHGLTDGKIYVFKSR